MVCVTFSFKAVQYDNVFSYNSAQKLMLFALGTGGNIRITKGDLISAVSCKRYM